MLKAKTHRTIASLLLGAVSLAAPVVSEAAAPVRLAGSITGTVKDTGGIPQMGAAVLLLKTAREATAVQNALERRAA